MALCTFLKRAVILSFFEAVSWIKNTCSWDTRPAISEQVPQACAGDPCDYSHGTVTINFLQHAPQEKVIILKKNASSQGIIPRFIFSGKLNTHNNQLSWNQLLWNNLIGKLSLNLVNLGLLQWYLKGLPRNYSAVIQQSSKNYVVTWLKRPINVTGYQGTLIQNWENAFAFHVQFNHAMLDKQDFQIYQTILPQYNSGKFSQPTVPNGSKWHRDAKWEKKQKKNPQKEMKTPNSINFT